MRFPKSNYARYAVGSPGWTGAIGGLLSFAVGAFYIPAVVWPITVFASGLVIYAMGIYVIALTAERRQAMRRGLPEPGTAGTMSFAEFTVFLSIALIFGIAALALTVYGIVNEVGGNRGEGGAGLGLGASAWFIAVFMGLFGSPVLIMWWHRQGPEEPDTPAQGSST
jgi:hypothetical protein